MSLKINTSAVRGIASRVYACDGQAQHALDSVRGLSVNAPGFLVQVRVEDLKGRISATLRLLGQQCENLSANLAGVADDVERTEGHAVDRALRIDPVTKTWVEPEELKRREELRKPPPPPPSPKPFPWPLGHPTERAPKPSTPTPTPQPGPSGKP